MWHLGYYFYILGFLYGGWAGRIPDIQLAVGASDAQFGVALFCSSLGAFASIFFAPRIIRRITSSGAVVVTTLCYAVLLPLLASVGSTPELCGVLFLLGGTSSVLDVAINLQAVRFEGLKCEKIVSRLHCIFSLGLVSGGITASIFSTVELILQLSICSIVVVVGAIWQRGYLMKDPETSPIGSRTARRWQVLASVQVRCLAVVLFAAALVEGALVEWSAKFFREDLLVSSWVAPLGIAALSSGMVIGRALGDWFRSRYQDAVLIGSCAAIATLHLAIFVSTETPVIALVTIFMSGLGLSVLVPIAYAAAGSGEGDAGVRTEDVLAQLTSFAYGALLLGPAVIGGLSDSFGLRGALWLLPVLMATAVIASTFSLKKPSPQGPSEK